MELKTLLIILLLIYLVIVLTPFIIYLIISVDQVKSKITQKINQSIKSLDLGKKQINPYFFTSIYDLDLYTYPIENDDYSIYFTLLLDLVINIKKLSGYFVFQFYVGPTYYLSFGDKVTIYFDNIYLNCTISVIYSPLKISSQNHFYNITYNLQSEKALWQYLLKNGIQSYKDNIEQKISDFIEDIPNQVQPILNKLTKKYNSIYKIIEVYVKLYYLAISIFSSIILIAFQIKLFIEEIIVNLKELMCKLIYFLLGIKLIN